MIPFDTAAYLDSKEAIAGYLSAVMEQDDADLLLAASNDMAKARGMAQIARDAGLGRESRYNALSPGAKPRFDTVMKVLHALGLKLHAE